MALKKEEFERGIVPVVSLSRTDGRNQQRIVALLKTNPLTAYSQGEIQRELEIKYPSAVNSALHSLQVKGCIEVRIVEGIQYWRFLHDVSNNKAPEVSKPVEGVVTSKEDGKRTSDDKEDGVNREVGKGVKGQGLGSKSHSKSGGGGKVNSKGRGSTRNS